MALSPRIALIHALKVSMEPVHAAFSVEWPQAELVNIWDDSLLGDRAKNSDLSEEISDRIVALGRYAVSTGADAILYTCSAFGRGIERAAEELSIPVLKPNEAMFQQALAKGSRIGMVVSFQPSVASMEKEFEEEKQRIGKDGKLHTILITEAMDALRNGDVTTHNHLVAESARSLVDCDAVMLAQFSMSRAAASVRAVIKTPVLTAPQTSVAKLKQLFSVP